MAEQLSVLIVDDNSDDRLLVIRELRKEFPALQVEEVTDAVEFRRALDAGGFDLVVTDYQLGWGDGLTVLRAVKGRHEACPVIMLTGTGNEEVAVEAMKAGLDDYILKTPRHRQRLPQSVRSVIEQSRQRVRHKQVEYRWRRVFESAPVGIFSSSDDGQLLTANPALSTMLGYESADELMEAARDIGAGLYIDGGRRGEFARLLQDDGMVRGFEAELRRKDGSGIPVVLNARRVEESVSTSCDVKVCYEGTVEDVTDRRRLEEQLREASKMEAIGRLAGGIAHELNNLLTIVLGSADFAEAALPGGHPAIDDISGIRTAAKRAAELISQLLAFARKKMVSPQVVELNRLVGKVGRMLGSILGERIELSVRLGDEVGRVNVDPGQIQEVLVHMAVNARDAMQDGGALEITTDSVTISSKPEPPVGGLAPGAYALIRVSDSGPGMLKEVRARVFEPFFTTKEVGKGRGMGLSSAYGTIKQSGGHIRVDSTPGVGTTFWIYLPEIGDAGATEPAERSGLQLDAELCGTETVLLVEDEPSVRGIAARALRRLGYEVLEASNGECALDVAEKRGPGVHVLVTDAVMPKMGGFELARRLGSGNPGLKVLLMSGYSEDVLFKQSKRRPGEGFLAKPFPPEALARAVRDLLDG